MIKSKSSKTKADFVCFFLYSFLKLVKSYIAIYSLWICIYLRRKDFGWWDIFCLGISLQVSDWIAGSAFLSAIINTLPYIPQSFHLQG